MATTNYWLWLATRRGMDSEGMQRVLDSFGTPERAYYASSAELEGLPLRPSQRVGLLDKSMDAVNDILLTCAQQDIRIVTFQDARYPDRLRSIPDPPMVLYMKGRDISFDEEVAIGVVGSRTPTSYGVRYAGKFGLELANAGAVVVSGIAEGLDSCALRGAMKAGGTVVSVLAGGVDVIFPRENYRLFEDVQATGALISEYPPGTPPLAAHFLRRNRILSGLCLGVLAVECRPVGGTMSTVNHALEQGREVFAVPGSLDSPMSAGTNRLIQDGAKLVTCGRDILEEYWTQFPAKLSLYGKMDDKTAEARLVDIQLPERAAKHDRPPKADKPPKPEKGPKPEPTHQPSPPEKPRREVVPRREQKHRFTDDELALLSAVSQDSLTAEQLVELTGIPAKRVLSALTMLQVQGAMEEQPGKRFYALVELE